MGSMPTLADFLLNTLKAHGVRKVFGIPGDFSVHFLEILEKTPGLDLVTLSHEPGVGFAADGAARSTHTLGVCSVTYGVGALNTVNPVACAYAEKSPVLLISGSPGLAERAPGVHVHHQTRSYDSHRTIYREITQYSAVLADPALAASQILTAVESALKFSRPAYLEIPRDLVDREIPVPAGPRPLALPADPEAVEEAAEEIVARLAAAKAPVLMAGEELHRFQLTPRAVALAERLGIPVVSSFMGRGAFPEDHPQFAGTYFGLAPQPELKALVEDSDCLLMLGVLVSDMNLGVRARGITPKHTIGCVSRTVTVGHHQYPHAPLADVLEAMLASGPARHPFGAAGRVPRKAYPDQVAGDPAAPLRMRDVLAVVNRFLRERGPMPIVADTGDALFGSVDLATTDIMGPGYYSTMGFAVPAAIGMQAASGRRPLVLVGDGAFQMTGPEIAHCPRHGLNPIVLVLNNGSWETQRAYCPGAGFNDILTWPYAEMARLWGGKGIVADSPPALAAALARAKDAARFTLVEAKLPRRDGSPVLERLSALRRDEARHGEADPGQ
jgi:indolepyruvate decarboxylase